MKKLLLIVLGLIAAGSIAFALSALSASSGAPMPGPAQGQPDPCRQASTLGMDDCIWYVGILECVPTPAGTCDVTFRAYHWDKSQNCCNHDAGDLWFSVNGGLHSKMTQNGTGHDDVTGCDFHIYDSAEFEDLANDATALYDVYDDATSSTCKKSGGLLIHCQ